MNSLNYKNRRSYESSKANVIEDNIDFQKLFQKLLNYWPLILISLIISFLAAYAFNKFTVPIYEVHTSILVKEPKDISNNVTQLLYGEEFVASKSSNLQNEIILIKKYELIEKTLRDLEFNVSYYTHNGFADIVIYKNSPFKVILNEGSQNTPFGIFIHVIALENNKFKLLIKEDDLEDNLEEIPFLKDFNTVLNLKTYTFGELININGCKFTINRTEKDFTPENEFYFKFANYNSLKKKYKSNLLIAPIQEEASILELSLQTVNRQKEIDFLNRLVQNYIQSGLEEKNVIAKNTIEFIDNELSQIEDSLNILEYQIEAFQKSNKSVDISVEGSTLYNKLQELEKEGSTLRIKMKYLDNMKEFITADKDLEQISIPSSFGITDTNLNNLIQQLIALRLENKRLESSKNLKNPLIRINNQSITNLKANILQSIEGIQGANEMVMSDLQKRIGSIDGSLRNLPAVERENINIQRTYTLSENLYTFLMQKRAEAGITEASNTVDVKLIDEATVKGQNPIYPKPIINYIIALFFGVSIPVLFIYVKDILNNKVESQEDITNVTSIPLLGIIAKIRKKEQGLLSANTSNGILLESLRNIRSNLRYLITNSEGSNTILVSSSISGEGKTFFSKYFAYIMSLTGKKTILVNVDLRKENSFKEFDIEKPEAGMSEMLAGMHEIEDVIVDTGIKNLYLIDAGKLPPNPSELLMSERMNILMKKLKEEFDCIILDSPPIGMLADALELTKFSDANILILRQNYSLKVHVDNVNALYEDEKLDNLAIVLNDVNLKKANYGYGYGYGYAYYHNKSNEKPWWKKLKQFSQ